VGRLFVDEQETTNPASNPSTRHPALRQTVVGSYYL